jgi:hypothetical protein
MKKIITILFIIALFGTTGCKDWLDINQNPNNASKATVTMALLLPSCQFYMINNHINTSYAHQISQHMTKSGEYSGNYPILNGQIMPQNMDDWWGTYYTTNSDLLTIYEKASEANDNAYKGIALTLFSINSQRLVDIFGNIPYFQAWKPLEFPTPEYDSDKLIYEDLVKKINEAITSLEAAVTSNYDASALAKVDIMCKGDLSKWVKMAYTIKLRILMRMSFVNDVSSQVTAIVDKCININDNIEANPGFYVETDKMHLFYEIYGWDKNGDENSNHRQFMPTSALVDMLRDNDDPRLRVFCDPRKTLGNPSYGADYEKFGLGDEYYIGIPYGQADPPGRYYTCWTGTGILAGSSDKKKGCIRNSTFITGAEVGFFLSEAALRGIIPGGDAKAKEYYEKAVISSMKRHEAGMQDINYGFEGEAPAITGTAEEAAKRYLSQPNSFSNWDLMGSNEKKMEAIGSQKWLNYFGYNPLEAWFEQRRTDTPKLKASNQGMESKNICRAPYPQTEMNQNSANYNKQPAIDIYNSRVFWDTKNEIVEKTELYF